jgi:predicted HAD superfamily Cof-like phosphohydrolase
VDKSLAKLRAALLQEEVGEFVTAAEKGDLAAIADALADIAYVVYGTALTYGIDLDPVLREVHRSNMSKLGRDGKPLMREDGKVLKSDRYFPPDIASVLGFRDRQHESRRALRHRPSQLLSVNGFMSRPAWCVLSVDPARLIAGRFVQGGFGALLIPQGIGISLW